MTDKLEAFTDWLRTTIAELEEMGHDDPVSPQHRARAANGRFVKKGKQQHG